MRGVRCQPEGMLVAALLFASAFAPLEKSWEAGVATAYVRGGSFDGPAFSAQSLWRPNAYFAVGAMIDVASLSADLTAGNGLPAAYAFTSTFAGGLAQLRLPQRFVEPYAALGLGYVAVDQRQALNVQCAVSSGPGLMLAGGANAGIGDHLTLGLRASVRNGYAEASCAAMAGPATFDAFKLFALGGPLDYRW
jgi:hypothetical protein